MVTNPVRKQVVGSNMVISTGEVRLRRGWVAVCPRCGKTCVARSPEPWYAKTRSKKRRSLVIVTSTRKQAKDALAYHQNYKDKFWNGITRAWEPACNPSPPAVVG